MGVTGSEWTKWVRNGPSALRMYLMYLCEAQSIGNGYCILEDRSNMYVTLQTQIEVLSILEVSKYLLYKKKLSLKARSGY